jgi:hypothetical protein
MVARHRFGDRKLELGDLKRFVHGADLFSRPSDRTTITAQSAKQEISLRLANTHRANNWSEVMQELGGAGRRLRTRWHSSDPIHSQTMWAAD